jgi:hypothetical protein
MKMPMGRRYSHPGHLRKLINAQWSLATAFETLWLVNARLHTLQTTKQSEAKATCRSINVVRPGLRQMSDQIRGRYFTLSISSIAGDLKLSSLLDRLAKADGCTLTSLSANGTRSSRPAGPAGWLCAPTKELRCMRLSDRANIRSQKEP